MELDLFSGQWYAFCFVFQSMSSYPRCLWDIYWTSSTVNRHCYRRYRKILPNVGREILLLLWTEDFTTNNKGKVRIVPVVLNYILSYGFKTNLLLYAYSWHLHCSHYVVCYTPDHFTAFTMLCIILLSPELYSLFCKLYSWPLHCIGYVMH